MVISLSSHFIHFFFIKTVIEEEIIVWLPNHKGVLRLLEQLKN
jgi:hypothetical protein